jgi:UPF0271 protein
MKEIDLNCDMGESLGIYKFGNDEIFAKYITTANVACGFHAGDPSTMKKTVDLLKMYGVAIGAHPGLPDIWGFGRRAMAISAEDARNYIIYQVGALKAFVEAAGLKLHHIKVHGALFTLSKFDDTLSRAILEGIRAVDPNLFIYCPGPLWLFKYEKHAKELGLNMVAEFYADLDYAPDGTLEISKLKREDRSIDVTKSVKKVLRYLREGKVTKTDGTELEFEAKSISFHGDTPNAGDLVKTLRTELEKAGIRVVPVM